MNGKFESCSNNQDESDVNQHLKELSEVSDCRSKQMTAKCLTDARAAMWRRAECLGNELVCLCLVIRADELGIF